MPVDANAAGPALGVHPADLRLCLLESETSHCIVEKDGAILSILGITLNMEALEDVLEHRNCRKIL